MHLVLLPLFALIMLLAPFGAAAQTLSDILANRADELAAGKTATIKEIAAEVAATRTPQTRAVLEAWIEGRLHYRRTDNLIIFAKKTDDGYRISDPISGEDLGSLGRKETKKVKNSTPIKAILRPGLAALDLSSTDPLRRLSAAQQLAKKPTEASRALLQQALESETVPENRRAMETATLIATFAVADETTVLDELAIMGDRLEPAVRGAVQRLSNDRNQTDAVRTAADARLASIETIVALNNFGNNILFGLSQASVLLLSAIGLAITFGVMRVINMAHGEFIMIGAYTTFVVQSSLPMAPGIGLLVSIPLAFAVAFVAGVILERLVIQFLYGRPLETLLATFGVSLVLQQSFRIIFTPQNRPIVTPDWLAGNLSVNPILGITTPRLFVFAIALAVFFGLLAFLQRSRFGLEMRAVTQNRAIAKTMGINSSRIDYLTFGLGSGIAGLAGAVLSQILKTNPDMGTDLIIPSFMVIVVGGVGSLWGALVGAGLVGMATKLVEPLFPNNTLLATAIILVAVIGFIQFRPRGLFAQKGRSAEL
ncbi:MAG: urea ABC transporter permease subunit UrtB [Geminicoccus sp.]|nr:urea ABC transporter permease subunit UrtB [Geminicoccus sp.]